MALCCYASVPASPVLCLTLTDLDEKTQTPPKSPNHVFVIVSPTYMYFHSHMENKTANPPILRSSITISTPKPPSKLQVHSFTPPLPRIPINRPRTPQARANNPSEPLPGRQLSPTDCPLVIQRCPPLRRGCGIRRRIPLLDGFAG